MKDRRRSPTFTLTQTASKSQTPFSSASNVRFQPANLLRKLLGVGNTCAYPKLLYVHVAAVCKASGGHTESLSLDVLIPFSKVHAYNGCEHTIVVMDDGRMVSFGYNYRGQLGHGTTSSEPIPKPVRGLDGIRVTQVSCSYYHSIIACNNGEVIEHDLIHGCWFGTRMAEINPLYRFDSFDRKHDRR